MALNRSFLFAPGNVARRVEKALTLEADAVIVDLEDSVAVSDKAVTRKPVAEALTRPRRPRGYLRVNAPASPFCYEDLVETIHKGVDGVVVPKVESAADLHAIDWLLAALERSRGIAEASIDLMPQIETAWFHCKEAEAFKRALERSRRGGFQGRCCVHPDQIALVNAAYLPSDEELARAERIVAAFREAEAKGAAAIQVDGQMIDYPVVYRAQALLDAMQKAAK